MQTAIIKSTTREKRYIHPSVYECGKTGRTLGPRVSTCGRLKFRYDVKHNRAHRMKRDSEFFPGKGCSGPNGRPGVRGEQAIVMDSREGMVRAVCSVRWKQRVIPRDDFNGTGPIDYRDAKELNEGRNE
jgi:hypothetical protein